MSFHDKSLLEQNEIIVGEGLTDRIIQFEEHIRTTQCPESFPLVLLSRPKNPDEPFMVLTQFAVDLNRRHHKKWVPCSVCSPKAGKFYKAGFLIYHIYSKEFRIVGSTCCKKDLAGWDEQVRKLRDRERQAERRAFVLKNAKAAIELREFLDRLKTYTDNWTSIRNQLRRQVPQIWNQLVNCTKLSPPSLIVLVHTQEKRFDPRTGKTRLVDVETEKTIAGFFGASGFSETWPATKKLNEAIKIFEEFSPSEAEEQARHHTDSRLSNYITKWTRAETLAQEVIELLDDARRFFTVHNFNGLSRWSRNQHLSKNFKATYSDDACFFRDFTTDDHVKIDAKLYQMSSLLKSPPRLRK